MSLESANIGYNYRTSSRNAGSTSGRSNGSSAQGNINDYNNWYLSLISKYQDNPELYDQLLNSPYYNVGDYQSYWYEDLLGLSDVSREKFYNQMRMDAKEYMMSLVDKYNDRSYDSAEEQVARMKLAGQNVDLSGGQGVSPGESGSVDLAHKDAVMPDPSGFSGAMNVASAVAQGVMSVVSNTFDFIGKINSFQLQSTDLATSELNGLMSADSWLTSMLKKTIKYQFDPEGKPDTNASSFRKALSDALLSVSSSNEFNSLNKRTRKYVNAVISNYDVDNISSKALYEELKNEYLSAREKNANIQANPNYSESFDNWLSQLTPLLTEFNNGLLGEYRAKSKQRDLVVSQISSNKASARRNNADADMVEYRKSKIDSVGSLFDQMKKTIPQGEKWSGIANWFTELSKILVIQGLVHE